MLESLLRSFAVVATCFLVTGWALFSLDEARSASDASSTAIATGLPNAVAPDPLPLAQERARERTSSGPRELVDDVNDVLLSPFAVVTDGAEHAWVRRTVPALIALLVFGFGGGCLARYAAARS